VVKITGERPVDGVTPDGLVALHTAGYLEVARQIGPSGRVLDIGCGVGFGASLLRAPGREVVGLDYDLGAARTASQRSDAPDLQIVCGDGGSLGLADAAFDWVASSHIIEHFTSPERHVAEIARVLKPDGAAFIFTPNAPADLENPFHVHLFTREQLRTMLSAHFSDVWVGGHDGTAEVKADFAARRASAARLLRLDFLKIRHRIPRRWYIAGYSAATRGFYRLQSKRHAGGATQITSDDFCAVDNVDDTTLSLFAIARRPRASSALG
jgi:SAM-dependent methyltransferase